MLALAVAFSTLVAQSFAAPATTSQLSARAIGASCKSIDLGRGKKYDYSDIYLVSNSNGGSERYQLSSYAPKVGGKVPLTVVGGNNYAAEIDFQSCDYLGYKTTTDSTGTTYYGNLVPGDSDSYNGCLGIRTGQKDAQLVWQRDVDTCTKTDDATQLSLMWSLRVPKDTSKPITASFLGKKKGQSGGGSYGLSLQTVQGVKTVEGQYNSNPNAGSAYHIELVPKMYTTGCSQIKLFGQDYNGLYIQDRGTGGQRRLTSTASEVGGKKRLTVQSGGNSTAVNAFITSCDVQGYKTIKGDNYVTYFGQLSTIHSQQLLVDGCYGVLAKQSNPQLVWPRVCVQDDSPEILPLLWSFQVPYDTSSPVKATFLGETAKQLAASNNGYYEIQLANIGGQQTVEALYHPGANNDNGQYDLILLPN